MTKREQVGRGDSRRLRRDKRVPATVYGGGQIFSVSCAENDIAARLHDPSFRSTVLTLNIDDAPAKALLREVQMHPYQRKVLHADFQLVSEDTEVAASVPLEFVNVDNAPGVKLRHGIFTTIENMLQVHCLPQDLPERIEVDVGELDIGRSIHLTDITPPAGVRFDALSRGEDLALATISEAKEEVEEAEVAAPEAAAEVAAGGDAAADSAKKD